MALCGSLYWQVQKQILANNDTNLYSFFIQDGFTTSCTFLADKTKSPNVEQSKMPKTDKNVKFCNIEHQKM